MSQTEDTSIHQIYLFHSLRILDHLNFRDVVRPCGIVQELRNLTAKVKEFSHDGLVDSQAVLKLLIRLTARLRVLSVFELKRS